MPSLTLDDNSAQYQIRSYQPGTITVNDKTLSSSIIITPTHLIENWAPQTADELTTASLSVIAEARPDILLIGTGATMVLLSAEIYGPLINLGIGVEFMDTSAACRTYNALSAENRNVAGRIINSLSVRCLYHAGAEKCAPFSPAYLSPEQFQSDNQQSRLPCQDSAATPDIQ